MEVKELMELVAKTYEILGWNGGGSVLLEPHVVDAGDLWMYVDVHDSQMGSDLVDSFMDLKGQLVTLFGNKQYGIEFHEDENSNSGYSVAIILEGPQ